MCVLVSAGGSDVVVAAGMRGHEERITAKYSQITNTWLIIFIFVLFFRLLLLLLLLFFNYYIIIILQPMNIVVSSS